MHIDHIGIVVRSIQKGISLWESVFDYKQFTRQVINERQKVKVVFLYKENSLMVKLIAPLDETSPIYAFSRRGGGLHHLCFKCTKIDEEMKRLNTLGVRTISPPVPGEAFENENIAFVFTKGLNVELIDTEKKAEQLEDYGHAIISEEISDK